MMRYLKVLIVLFMLIISTTMAQAVLVNYIDIDNCVWDMGSADCGDVAQASCDLTSLLTGGGVSNLDITSVKFTIAGVAHTATLDSGSAVNGTWVVDYEITTGMASTLTIEEVAVIEESGGSCLATQVVKSPPGCLWTISGNLNLGNVCSCTYAESAGSLLPTNRREFLRTPSAGCGDVETTVFYEWVDYCDPEWTPVYTECIGAWNASGSPTGTTFKSYSSANPACCAATADGAGYIDYNHGGGSDCVPPPDGSSPANEFQCALGAWPKYQDEMSALGGDSRDSGLLYDDLTEYSRSNQVLHQPVVFDMDRDGFDEIVVYDNASGELRMYGFDMQLESAVVVGVNYTVSQIALAGVDDYGSTQASFASGYQLSAFVASGGSPKVVVPVFDGVDAYVRTYEVVAGSLTLDNTDIYPSVGGISGVACMVDTVSSTDCYFVTGDGRQWRYNIEGDTSYPSTYKFPFWLTAWFENTVGTTIDAFMVPTIYIDQTGQDRIAWWWVNNATWDAFSSSKILYHGVITDEDLIAVSSFRVITPGIGSYANNEDVQLWNPVAMNWGNFNTGQIVFTGAFPYFASGDKMIVVAGMLTPGSQDSNVDVTAKNVWHGDKEDGDCVSNPVSVACGDSSANYVGMQYNVVNRAFGAASGGNDPALLFGRTMESFENCTIRPTDCVNYELRGAWAIDEQYQIILSYQQYTASYYYLYDSYADNMRVIFSDSAGSMNGGHSDLYFDPETEYLWVINSYSQSCGFPCTNRRQNLDVYDLTDKFAFAHIYSEQQSCSSNGPSCWDRFGKIMPVDDYMMWGRRAFDRDNPALGSIASLPSDRYGSYGQHTEIAYDVNDDRMYVEPAGGGIGIFEGFAAELDGGANATEIALDRDQIVFNFDSGDPRFITRVTSGAKMVRQTSPGSGTWVTTTTGCGFDFNALYYKSDNYIVGIVYDPYASGGINVESYMAVCDFSDQGNPTVTRFDLAMDDGSSGYGRYYTVYDDKDGNGAGFVAFMFPGYTAGVPDGEYLTLFSYDDGHAASVPASLYGKAVCIDPRNGVVGRSTGIPAGAICGPITRAYVNDDAYHDLVGIGGIASPATYEWLTTFNPSHAYEPMSWAMAMDLDGNLVTDMLQMRTPQSTLKAMISNVALESVAIGDPSLDSLNCIQRDESNVVVVQVVGKMPNPELTVIVLNYPECGSGSCTSGVDHEYPRADGPTFDIPFEVPGTHTITGYFRQKYPEVLTSNKESCTVEITQTATGLQVCSLGNDGEFNYDSTLADHSWYGTGSSAQPTEGYVELAAGREVTYDVPGCISSFTTIEQRVNLNHGTRFEVLDGQGRTLIGYFSNDGQLLSVTGENLAEHDPNSWYIMSIEIDPSTSLMTIKMNGDAIYSVDGSAIVGSVKMIHTGKVDYVRVSGQGLPDGEGGIVGDADGDGIVDPGEGEVTAEGDWLILEQCNASIRDDPDIGVRNSYVTLAEYCLTVKGGSCDYSDLQKVIQVNGDCTKEAMNYCVKVTHPLKLKGVGSDSAIIEGGTVCAANLGVSALFTKIGTPIGGIVWTVFTSNWQTILLIALVAVLIALATKKRK